MKPLVSLVNALFLDDCCDPQAPGHHLGELVMKSSSTRVSFGGCLRFVEEQ